MKTLFVDPILGEISIHDIIKCTFFVSINCKCIKCGLKLLTSIDIGGRLTENYKKGKTERSFFDTIKKKEKTIDNDNIVEGVKK